jgi:hypothetical protein
MTIVSQKGDNMSMKYKGYLQKKFRMLIVHGMTREKKQAVNFNPGS